MNPTLKSPQCETKIRNLRFSNENPTFQFYLTKILLLLATCVNITQFCCLINEQTLEQEIFPVH